MQPFIRNLFLLAAVLLLKNHGAHSKEVDDRFDLTCTSEPVGRGMGSTNQYHVNTTKQEWCAEPGWPCDKPQRLVETPEQLWFMQGYQAKGADGTNFTDIWVERSNGRYHAVTRGPSVGVLRWEGSCQKGPYGSPSPKLF